MTTMYVYDPDDWRNTIIIKWINNLLWINLLILNMILYINKWQVNINNFDSCIECIKGVLMVDIDHQLLLNFQNN